MGERFRQNLLIIALATIISTSFYFMWSYIYFKIGYPLDDSWIYQTYARNLNEFGEWSFIPGTQSGGSTGPLWVVFIVLGYFLNINTILLWKKL